MDAGGEGRATVADENRTTESAVSVPVATPEEAARTQDRLGSFVHAAGAESAPPAYPHDRREAWLNRINYQDRRQKIAFRRRKGDK